MPCQQQATAFCTALIRSDGRPASEECFATKQECERVVGKYHPTKAIPIISRCTEFGSVEPVGPAIDLSVVPSGTDWHCYRRIDSDASFCFRAADKCEEERAEEARINNSPEPSCARTAIASCFSADKKARCAVDLISCNTEQWSSHQYHSSTSRCADVGATSQPDTDKDAVENDRDKCPDQAEDNNGFEDDDGCPDQARADEQRRIADEAARKQAEEDAKRKDAAKLSDQQKHDKALGHFKQAEAFFNAKAYPEAIAEYEAGMALEAWPPALFNIGESHRLDGKRDKAIDAYKKYLEALPKGPRAGDARRHIAELTKQLRDQQKP